MTHTLARERRVFLASLGCAKNLVDSEVMLGSLTSAGWAVTAQPDDADAVIVNTCAFIDPAKAESTDAILRYAQAKRPGQTLVVAGCLAQRYGAQLRELIPEIDAVVGTGAFPRIRETIDAAIGGARPLDLEGRDENVERFGFLPRLVTTPRATAYLKISEGCNHTCAFCIIPKLRGIGKSRSLDSLEREARALVDGGARELVVVSQDTSDYGRDIGLRDGLAQLIERLEAVDALRWVRLLYLYPTSVSDRIIAAMRASTKVVPYVDMPLQHTHPVILKAMRRPPQPERYLELFAKLREAVPAATIRSTFIIGFPGETGERFEHLLDFIGRARLDRVGFFAFSREEGTPAFDMREQVPAREKKARLARARELQTSIANANDAARIGETLDVLVEGRRLLPPESPVRAALGERLVSVGRSPREAPQVDGQVLVAGAHEPGSFVRTTISGYTAFDRFGAPATRDAALDEKESQCLTA
ncbi:MAG TPA: 30S ribosomal protein S12 methylthiotransferase RimO [Candidatus Eremiobacteraceae bacterium]|nr:30S ribosomal protein S12 methylthiotransferase RimO [Candidatus Eremiobacteraceae bacterium]